MSPFNMWDHLDKLPPAEEFDRATKLGRELLARLKGRGVSILDLWVIYHRPTDYPTSYVLRSQSVTASGQIIPGSYALAGDTIEAVRAHLPPGMTRIQGPGDDPDPHIVEVWI